MSIINILRTSPLRILRVAKFSQHTLVLAEQQVLEYMSWNSSAGPQYYPMYMTRSDIYQPAQEIWNTL